MTDYKKDTGSSGTMMIRVGESTIAFMINSNNSSTQCTIPWGYTVNGTTNNTRETRYDAGDGWIVLGTWTVTTDQTVTFRIQDTGTSGFGGPTSFSVAINRAQAPQPPTQPVLSAVGSTTMNVTFTDNYNGGDAIDARQIGYSKTNTTSSGLTTVSSDRSTTLTGLTPGTTYYVWARNHNSVGWSVWSTVRSAKTLKVGEAPDPVIVSDATQNSVVVSFTDNSNGGTAVLERQIAYSTVNTTTGALTVPYTGVRTITGLLPATTYFFWARVRNSVGWGPYSPVVSDRTVAGAYLNVDGVWKEAIPYVKVSGVWKLARPWARIAGAWKETL